MGSGETAEALGVGGGGWCCDGGKWDNSRLPGSGVPFEDQAVLRPS